jgi:hypothetical protein
LKVLRWLSTGNEQIPCPQPQVLLLAQVSMAGGSGNAECREKMAGDLQSFIEKHCKQKRDTEDKQKGRGVSRAFFRFGKRD